MTLDVSGSGLTEATVSPLLDRVRLVPDDLRRFRATTADAAAVWGLSAQVLTDLVERGLPAERSGGDFRFDEFDLGNLALHLGCRSVQRKVIRSWARTLDRYAGAGTATFTVTYRPDCPDPRHDGPCEWEVAGRDGVAVREVERGEPALTLTRVADEPAVRMPATLSSLLRDISRFEFWILPHPLRADTRFLRRTRLADCGGAAAVLIEEAAALGIPGRRRFGLLLAEPYATPHFWSEVLIEDTWVAVDPLLVSMLTRWGGLDPATWPPERSPALILLPLAADRPPVVRHKGVPAPSSYPCAARAGGHEDVASSASGTGRGPHG